MAINLTGKSDATLVTAATRAGLATSPKSYQEIFEDVSQTYGETMQAVTESWKEITELTKTIGLEAVENAIYHTKKKNFVESTGISDEDGEFYIDKLQDIKKRLQGAVGLKERLKINRERDELYAQVEMFDAERKLVLNALASGNVDAKSMGANTMELLNAIAATGTEKKTTKQGNYFAATEDPLTGEIMYTLMKDPSILIDKEPKDAPVIGPRKSSQKVLGADGKPIVIRAGDVEKSIMLKNPQLPIDLTKVLNNVEKTSSQIGGIYTDYEKNKVRKQFVPFVETSSGLKQSLRANFGGLENSFYDELTNPGKDGSMLSADIFNALKSALGTTVDGQIDGEGILKGVKDTDGKKGLSKDELSNGYMFMSGAIMNLADEDATREIFLNWAESKASEAWEYGRRKYQLRNPSDSDDSSNKDTSRSLGWGIDYPSTGGIGEGTKKVAYSTLENRRNDLLNFEGFSGEYFDYRWDGKNWFAYDSGVKVDNIEGLGLDIKDGISMKNIAKIEGLKKFNEGYSIFDEKVAKKNKEKAESKTPNIFGGITLEDLRTTKDLTNLSAKMNSIFGDNFNDLYDYSTLISTPERPRSGLLGILGYTERVPVKEITIIKKSTGEEIKINFGPNATKKDADKINNLLAEDFLGDQIPGE